MMVQTCQAKCARCAESVLDCDDTLVGTRIVIASKRQEGVRNLLKKVRVQLQCIAIPADTTGSCPACCLSLQSLSR